MGTFAERFNTYIESVTASILSLIRGRGINDDTEHDVYQVTCLKFYRWLSELELSEPGQDPADHERMLRKMAVQCAIDELRRRRAEKVLIRDESRSDEQDDDGERIFGPGLEPNPERLLLNREREHECQKFLQAVAKCRGKQVLMGLIKIAEGCSASETVEFIEWYLFHNRSTDGPPRKDLTDQLCAQLRITQNAVAIHCFRLRPAWARLKREVLGEQVRTRLRARRFKAPGSETSAPPPAHHICPIAEKRRKTERSGRLLSFRTWEGRSDGP